MEDRPVEIEFCDIIPSIGWRYGGSEVKIEDYQRLFREEKGCALFFVILEYYVDDEGHTKRNINIVCTPNLSMPFYCPPPPLLLHPGQSHISLSWLRTPAPPWSVEFPACASGACCSCPVQRRALIPRWNTAPVPGPSSGVCGPVRERVVGEYLTGGKNHLE